MALEKFFVTGSLGCIGAWVVRNLVQQGTPVTVFDLGHSKHRLELIMSGDEINRVTFIHNDITDSKAVAQAVQTSRATHIIHLAALQIPFCRANPVLGAQVNVVGTVNVFEAAKQAGLKQVVYASSIAVYGPKSAYPPGLVAHNAPLIPQNLYGVFKQANEGTAQIYRQEAGIASIGLRPYTIYGPGRDQGLTSAPTEAMLAAAAGRPYHIPFGGRSGFQLVDDVAKIFIRAARTPFEGAAVFNIKGSVVHMRQVVDAIEQAEPLARGQITFDDRPLPFPDGQDDSALRQLLGEVPDTPLEEGVAATIRHFKQALLDGRITGPA